MKFLITVIFFGTVNLFAEIDNPTEQTSKQNVKYHSPKTINFDDVLVKGKLEKPEMAIITANEDDDLSGILRLRENFVDSFDRTVGDAQ